MLLGSFGVDCRTVLHASCSVDRPYQDRLCWFIYFGQFLRGSLRSPRRLLFPPVSKGGEGGFPRWQLPHPPGPPFVKGGVKTFWTRSKATGVHVAHLNRGSNGSAVAAHLWDPQTTCP